MSHQILLGWAKDPVLSWDQQHFCCCWAMVCCGALKPMHNQQNGTAVELSPIDLVSLQESYWLSKEDGILPKQFKFV